MPLKATFCDSTGYLITVFSNYLPPKSIAAVLDRAIYGSWGGHTVTALYVGTSHNEARYNEGALYNQHLASYLHHYLVYYAIRTDLLPILPCVIGVLLHLIN